LILVDDIYVENFLRSKLVRPEGDIYGQYIANNIDAGKCLQNVGLKKLDNVNLKAKLKVKFK